MDLAGWTRAQFRRGHPAGDQRADDARAAVEGGESGCQAREKRQRVDREREQQPAEEADAGNAQNKSDDEHGGCLRDKGPNGRAFHHHHHGAPWSIAEDDGWRQRKSGTQIRLECPSLAADHAWQTRPLDAVYPIVYLDALVVKMRSDGRVENRAVYVAIGITLAGMKEVLGLWTSANEGAKFWLQVLTEMQNRGLKDIFIACVDGLKGFPQAIETVYPKTTVQLCIVHMVRASLNYVNWKQRKRVAQDLKSIYRAATAEEAEHQLAEFATQWDRQYPSISALWRRNWQGVIPFFQFPPEIRKIVYTTNAIESLNMSLRKAIKTRGAFPSEDAALKVMYLALRNLARKWNAVQGWKEALNRFALVWEARFPHQCV